MKTKTRKTPLPAALALGALALPALAQQVREQPLKGNPYRDGGGSCVYGRNGELLHAPKGTRCPSREEAPGASAPDPSEQFAGLPPALRAEASALVGSHAHVADDLVELRRTVAMNDTAKALELSDEVAKELVEHLAREQAPFEKLAAEHREH